MPLQDVPEYFVCIGSGRTFDDKGYFRYRLPADKREEVLAWIRSGGHYVFRHHSLFRSGGQVERAMNNRFRLHQALAVDYDPFSTKVQAIWWLKTEQQVDLYLYNKYATDGSTDINAPSILGIWSPKKFKTIQGWLQKKLGM